MRIRVPPHREDPEVGTDITPPREAASEVEEEAPRRGGRALLPELWTIPRFRIRSCHPRFGISRSSISSSNP